MKEMIDSGILWVGDIPKDWTIKKVKYCLKSRNEQNNPIKTNNILSLTVNQGVVPLKEKEGAGGNKPKDDLTKYKLAYPGDIVMNCMNVISGSVNLSNYYGCVSPVYYMLRPIDEHENVSYYNYLFQNTGFQRGLLAIANGILMHESSTGKLNTIRMRVSMDSLNNIYLPHPSILEQNVIVSFLDSKCSAIEEAIERHKKIIEKLEEYKRAFIISAVSGLTSERQTKDSGIPWMKTIPKEWSVFPLRFVFGERKNKNTGMVENNLLTLSYGKVKRKDINTNEGLLPASFEGYNIIEAGDIVLRLMDLQNDKHSLRTGLVTERGIITSAYVTLYPKINIFSPYFRYLLHAYDLRKVLYTMGEGIRQSLNYDDIGRGLLIPMPTYNEQVKIVQSIVALEDKVDTAINRQERTIEKIEEYRKSIIYNAVTGKIDCRGA